MQVKRTLPIRICISLRSAIIKFFINMRMRVRSTIFGVCCAGLRFRRMLSSRWRALLPSQRTTHEYIKHVVNVCRAAFLILTVTPRSVKVFNFTRKLNILCPLTTWMWNALDCHSKAHGFQILNKWWQRARWFFVFIFIIYISACFVGCVMEIMMMYGHAMIYCDKCACLCNYYTSEMKNQLTN